MDISVRIMAVLKIIGTIWTNLVDERGRNTTKIKRKTITTQYVAIWRHFSGTWFSHLCYDYTMCPKTTHLNSEMTVCACQAHRKGFIFIAFLWYFPTVPVLPSPIIIHCFKKWFSVSVFLTSCCKPNWSLLHFCTWLDRYIRWARNQNILLRRRTH